MKVSSLNIIITANQNINQVNFKKLYQFIIKTKQKLESSSNKKCRTLFGRLVSKNLLESSNIDQNQIHFTSQFYSLNCSKIDMEDFDLSEEYLKSQICQKSTILRHLSQQNFLKILQTYDKVCAAQALSQWRKINAQQKKLQLRNPKNMTKLFLKLFHLLNKKKRAKVEKSFVKIVNFTKHHQMKSYETPLVRGLNKLNQTLQTLNSKYFYDHPINSHWLIGQSMKEITLYCKTLNNKEQLTRFVKIMQKMANQIAQETFQEKLKAYKKLYEKLQILKGTLSLIINPIKRLFILKFKILNDIFLYETKSLKKSSFKQETSLQNSDQSQQLLQTKNLQAIKRQSSLNSSKNTLMVSKFIARQQSTSSLKKKLKFKKDQQDEQLITQTKIPVKSLEKINNEKKQKQAFFQDCLRRKNFDLSPLQTINANESRFILNSKFLQTKALKINAVFENSLTYEEKISRSIDSCIKSKTISICKPQQFAIQHPDYCDYVNFSNLIMLGQRQACPFAQQEIKQQIHIDKDQKSKTFKQVNESPDTALSHYLFNNSQGVNTTSIKKIKQQALRKNKKKPPLFPKDLKFISAESSNSKNSVYSRFSQNNLSKRMISEQRQKMSLNRSQSVDRNFFKKCSKKKISSTDQKICKSFKNQYFFPITQNHRQKKQNGQFLKISSNPLQNQYYNHYQATQLQPNNKKNRNKKKSLTKKNQSNSLKKKQSVSNNKFKPNKKLKKEQKKSIEKPKKPKQMSSDYNQHSSKVNGILQEVAQLSIFSGKSKVGSQKSLKNNAGQKKMRETNLKR